MTRKELRTSVCFHGLRGSHKSTCSSPRRKYPVGRIPRSSVSLADGLNRRHGPREDEEDGLGDSGRGWLFPASTEEGIKGFRNDGLGSNLLCSSHAFNDSGT